MSFNDSFGGTNRGPGSGRPRRRSNSFVDVGFMALVIGCSGAVAYQYLPMLSTAGYNVASGHLKRMGWQYYHPFSSGYSHYGRGRDYVDFLQADFTYTTGGQTYSSTVTSVPLISLLGFGDYVVNADLAKNVLSVRYDPSNPQKCVPVEVIDSYTKSALLTYGCVFFAGLVGLVLAGLTNLSTDTWRPGQRTDAY